MTHVCASINSNLAVSHIHIIYIPTTRANCCFLSNNMQRQIISLQSRIRTDPLKWKHSPNHKKNPFQLSIFTINMCIDYHSQRIWSHLVCEFLWHRCVILFAYYIQFEGRRKSEIKWNEVNKQMNVFRTHTVDAVPLVQK